ncbi:hypothetical protein OSK38_29620, partial [Escherichia coli]|nr:hypothetical protein [Escherichia coli]
PIQRLLKAWQKQFPAKPEGTVSKIIKGLHLNGLEGEKLSDYRPVKLYTSVTQKNTRYQIV